MKKLQAELAELGMQVNGKSVGAADETKQEALQLLAEIEGRMAAIEQELQATQKLTTRVRKLLGGEAVAERTALPRLNQPHPTVPMPGPPAVPQQLHAGPTPAHMIPTPQISPGVPIPDAMPDAFMPAPSVPMPNLPSANNPVTHVVKAADLQVPQVQPVHQFGPAAPAAMAARAGDNAAAIARSGMPALPGMGRAAGLQSIHPSQFRPRAELVRPPVSGISPESEGLLVGIEMPKPSK